MLILETERLYLREMTPPISVLGKILHAEAVYSIICDTDTAARWRMQRHECRQLWNQTLSWDRHSAFFCMS